MTNLDRILKSKDIILLTKVHIVKVMFFSVIMYRCSSWTIKKPEHWRIDAFKLWCWRRLLRVPWTARRANQLILKEINPEYSLEGLILKLKFHYFGHLMWRVNSLEKNPDAGKDWRQKVKRVAEDEMVYSITDSVDMRCSQWGLTTEQQNLSWNFSSYFLPTTRFGSSIFQNKIWIFPHFWKINYRGK